MTTVFPILRYRDPAAALGFLERAFGFAYVAVEDVDALHDRAKAAAAEIVMAPFETDYGSRDFTARDAEGNVWSFGSYRPR